MYNSSTFISAYNPTDYALVFTDTTGRRVRGINVCRYLNSGVDSNIIWVLLEGDEKIVLDFASVFEANSAITNLKTAIDSLIPNCPIGGSGGSPLPSQTLTINSVTVVQYEVLRAAGELTNTSHADKVQWYDVSDTGNLFGQGAGSVFRVLALHPTDGEPIGFCVNSLVMGIMDFDLYKFQNTYNDSLFQITSNNSQINDTIHSKNLISVNNSRIVTKGKESSFIIANNSVLEVEGCRNIFAENCEVLFLTKSTNCWFENIKGDYSTYSFSDVKVHSNDTIGKVGHQTIKTVDITLQAYINYTNVYLPDTGGFFIALQNVIPQANATFNLIVPVKFTKTIDIKDHASGSLLLTIDPAYVGLTLTFIYDKGLDKWYYEKKSDCTKRNILPLPVTANGQTLFVDVLAYTPKQEVLSTLYVNGQKLVHGVDYNFAGLSVVWTNASFTLETTDYVELYYE